MLKEMKAIKLTCDVCGLEKIHIKEYKWQSSFPENWIMGRIHKNFIVEDKYFHYCSTDCFKKRAIEVEMAP